MSGIHQFVPMLHRRDAVGEHTRVLRDLLVAAGVTSRIYTEIPDPETADETLPYRQYESDAEPGDVLVYQVATRSEMAGWLVQRQEKLVLNYHSITPPEYFAPWNNSIARLQVGAIGELSVLARRAALGIGVSAFDVGELRLAGCGDTRVIPVDNLRSPPVPADPSVLELLARRSAGRGPWWLSVGRLAPNKCHQDTIAALFVARENGSPGAHLTIVGSPSEPAYAAALQRYARMLGVADAVEFVCGITEGALSARYVSADVLVMVSEHEGFGVPLLEAMAHGLPVVAYDAGAVAEVMGDAGVLLDAKSPRRVAAEVAGLLADQARQDELRAAGRARLQSLGLDRAGGDMVQALVDVAAQP